MSASNPTSTTNPSSVVSSMVFGLDLVADAEQIYNADVQDVQRPGVLKRILATAGGTLASAMYLSRGSNERNYIVAAAYALLSAGMGINVGLYMGDSRLDAVGAAGIYYTLYSAGANLGFNSAPPQLSYEAAAALVFGLIANTTMRSTAPSSSSSSASSNSNSSCSCNHSN
jgi:hypothetical protein